MNGKKIGENIWMSRRKAAHIRMKMTILIERILNRK